MKFVFEKYLKNRNNVVCVDGLFDAKLQVSHWRGNNTPAEFKADTTTEMAFKLIESLDKDKYLNGIDTVSNNHFDADGLISAFVLVNPEIALQNKQSLINTAITGDFAEFTTEDALKTSIVIDSMFDMEKSMFRTELTNKSYPDIVQLLYEKGFEILPALINSIDDYEQFWKDEFREYKESEKSFITQNSVFSNYSDCRLSVIESTFSLHKVARYAHAENDIVLSAVKTAKGNHYELEYKLHTWFDTTRQKRIKRKDLNPLAGKLNLIEEEKTGKWQVYGKDPLGDWDYKLVYSSEDFKSVHSKLAVYEIENILFDYFLEG